MDDSDNSVGVFNKFAEMYRDKFMDLTHYDDSYGEFCELVKPGSARVLDAACGPGNVARFLKAQRPELDVLGIDLAPRMVDLARAAVPEARFMVYDCRQLAELEWTFDGVICAFGLPYFTGKEGTAFIRAAGERLEAGGVLYVSTMLGRYEDSGPEACSTGDLVHVTYYREEQVVRMFQESGFRVVGQRRLPSPSVASKATVDLILIGRKHEAAQNFPSNEGGDEEAERNRNESNHTDASGEEHGCEH